MNLNREEVKSLAKELEIKPSAILTLFSALLQKPVANNELPALLSLPKTHGQRLLSSVKEYLGPVSQQVTVNEEKRQQVEAFITAEKISVGETRKKLEEFLGKILATRPPAKRELDQFYATPETTIKKALLLLENGDLYLQNILLLGDDDLVSLCLAYMGGPNSITVLDIDADILSFIHNTAQEHNLPIETVQHDLRAAYNLPKKYDVILTDPPYTPAGISLFLNQGITFLEKANSSRLYFCYGNSARAPERILHVQQLVLEKNLVFLSILDQFNQYLGAESIGNSSSMYICGLTPQTKTTESPREKIYTHE